MEKYIIKVNGKEYEVEVEKVSGEPQVTSAAPKAAPAAPAPAPKAPAAATADGVKLEAGAAGKVFRVFREVVVISRAVSRVLAMCRIASLRRAIKVYQHRRRPLSLRLR